MWSIESRWFDVAVVMSIFAVGNILFGHFEQHKPRWAAAQGGHRAGSVSRACGVGRSVVGLWRARDALDRSRLCAFVVAAGARNRWVDRRAARQISRTGDARTRCLTSPSQKFLRWPDRLTRIRLPSFRQWCFMRAQRLSRTSRCYRSRWPPSSDRSHASSSG